jgi:hypothetical protein
LGSEGAPWLQPTEEEELQAAIRLSLADTAAADEDELRAALRLSLAS